MKKVLPVILLSLLVGCSSIQEDVTWVEVVVPDGGSVWTSIQENTEGGDIRKLVHLYEEENGNVQVHANERISIPVIEE